MDKVPDACINRYQISISSSPLQYGILYTLIPYRQFSCGALLTNYFFWPIKVHFTIKGKNSYTNMS